MNAHELSLTTPGQRSRPGPGRDSVVHSPREVLERTWEDVQPELARVAAAMGVRNDRIDDVLQEVFVIAWRKPPDRISDQQLKWWLIRVATNRCNLEHRRQQRWRVVQEQVGRLRSAFGSTSHGRQAAIEAEERGLVRQALARLPPQQRSVLVLRYFEGYDAKEIGQILDMAHATVRSHLHRARRALAAVLTECGYEHEYEYEDE